MSSQTSIDLFGEDVSSHVNVAYVTENETAAILFSTELFILHYRQNSAAILSAAN